MAKLNILSILKSNICIFICHSIAITECIHRVSEQKKNSGEACVKDEACVEGTTCQAKADGQGTVCGKTPDHVHHKHCHISMMFISRSVKRTT